MMGKVDVPISPPQHFDSSAEQYHKFQTMLDLYFDLNKKVFDDDQKKVAFTLSLM